MSHKRKRYFALIISAVMLFAQIPVTALGETGLPEGYACDLLPTVKAPLGEANTYAVNNSLEEEGIKIVASENGEVEYNVGSGFKLKASGTYEISGIWSGTLDAGSSSNSKAVITIPDSVIANVALNGVAINVSDEKHACAFAVETNGTANITLSGTNTLASGYARAGLEVPKGASVTIAGSGSLTASGGDSASGIGGSKGTNNQYEPDAGSITISGAANVTAQGSNYAAGIGGGDVGDGGTIIIRGGTVTAKGGGSNDSLGGGAGIGGGRAYGGKGHGGTITISGGSVSATGSARGAGIGGGGGSLSGVAGGGGHITISGGSVVAVGSEHGAGIGGGGGGNAANDGGEAGTIEINGDTVIFAIAPGKGAHIGSGGNSSNEGTNSGSFTEGVVFEGQQGTVHGRPTLVGDVTIPQDHTLTVPDGSVLTVPDGTTLSNNGTIENNGTISGEGSIENHGTVNDHSGGIAVTVDGVGAVNKPSEVEITFTDSQSGQITQAAYGDTIEIIATAQRKDINTLAARGASLNQVDFYIDAIAPEHKLGTADARTDSSTAAAVLKITLTGEAWNKGFAIGENTIIADFGGADTLNLLSSIGTAKLNVKVPPTLSLEAAPAGAQTLPGTVTLTAILLDAYPNNVGKTIVFTVNGSEHGTAVTNDSGVAAYSLTNLPQGGYTFGASFAGDSLNLQATAAQISGYAIALPKANTPSGGGRGNSSNGSTVTTQTPQPTAEDPNPPAVGKITPTVTVDQDGKVTVSVSDGDIQSAIDKATAQAKKDGTLANGIAVSIDLTGLKTQFHTLPLTLSRTVYQKLVAAGVNYMSIATPQISLSLDLETLKTISASAAGNVTISAARAEDSRLPEGMQNRPAYDLTIVSGGKQISDFGKGNITVTLPYALQETEQGGSLRMAYVDTEGKAQNMTNSGYHANQSAVIGRTNHFTVFGIALKPAPVFKDIEGHWAKDDILFVASQGILNGTGEQRFSPDTPMTRGMFVTALGQLAGVDAGQFQSPGFRDVAAESYYAPYVSWASEKKIVSGVSAGVFEPDRAISRQELAVIMKNYAEGLNYQFPVNREAAAFADEKKSAAWALEAIGALQQADVLSGKGDNLFDPEGTATRAEVSAVIRRFLELVVDPILMK